MKLVLGILTLLFACSPLFAQNYDIRCIRTLAKIGVRKSVENLANPLPSIDDLEVNRRIYTDLEKLARRGWISPAKNLPFAILNAKSQQTNERLFAVKVPCLEGETPQYVFYSSKGKRIDLEQRNGKPLIFPSHAPEDFDLSDGTRIRFDGNENGPLFLITQKKHGIQFKPVEFIRSTQQTLAEKNNGLAEAVAELETIAPDVITIAYTLQVEQGRVPTISEVADAMLSRVELTTMEKIGEVRRLYGSADEAVDHLLAEAEKMIVSSARGFAKTAKKGNENVPFDPENKVQVLTLNRINSKIFGELGELQVAIHVPRFQERGKKIKDVNPTPVDIQEASAELRDELAADPKYSLENRLETAKKKKAYLAKNPKIELSPQEVAEVMSTYPAYLDGLVKERIANRAMSKRLQEIRKKLETEFEPDRIDAMLDKEVDVINLERPPVPIAIKEIVEDRFLDVLNKTNEPSDAHVVYEPFTIHIHSEVASSSPSQDHRESVEREILKLHKEGKVFLENDSVIRLFPIKNIETGKENTFVAIPQFGKSEPLFIFFDGATGKRIDRENAIGKSKVIDTSSLVSPVEPYYLYNSQRKVREQRQKIKKIEEELLALERGTSKFPDGESETRMSSLREDLKRESLIFEERNLIHLLDRFRYEGGEASINEARESFEKLKSLLNGDIEVLQKSMTDMPVTLQLDQLIETENRLTETRAFLKYHQFNYDEAFQQLEQMGNVDSSGERTQNARLRLEEAKKSIEVAKGLILKLEKRRQDEEHKVGKDAAQSLPLFLHQKIMGIRKRLEHLTEELQRYKSHLDEAHRQYNSIRRASGSNDSDAMRSVMYQAQLARIEIGKIRSEELELQQQLFKLIEVKEKIAWVEVKNYPMVIGVAELTEKKMGANGKPQKSILEQAIENVKLARALHGSKVVVKQVLINGITKEAAALLEKEAPGIVVERIMPQ